ncbi:MAG: hypothetical protein EXS37_01900 [Opitutus sp.]|nr:hypothetical protein [Opitutus sp.]
MFHLGFEVADGDTVIAHVSLLGLQNLSRAVHLLPCALQRGILAGGRPREPRRPERRRRRAGRRGPDRFNFGLQQTQPRFVVAQVSFALPQRLVVLVQAAALLDEGRGPFLGGGTGEFQDRLR